MGVAVQPFNVPVPGLLLFNVRVMTAELATTVCPSASSTVPTSWVVSAEPLTPLPGCVVKTTLVAVPVAVKALLVAGYYRFSARALPPYPAGTGVC